MMFEALAARARRKAEARAAAAAERIAGRLRGELPPGLRADVVDGGVRISGRRARRRFALEPGLRWLMERMR
ncbi:MAG: hypothetical protein ACK4K7_09680 [Allosphingosinicella sp.]